MKDLSVKEYCFIVITICIVAITINRWNIGRYEITEGDKLLDTKNAILYQSNGEKAIEYHYTKEKLVNKKVKIIK